MPQKAQEVLPLATDWAGKINAAWNKSAMAFIEAGRLLLDAKAALSPDDFKAMVDSDLHFTIRTADRLMAIGADARLETHVSLLPPSWATLYELTRLPDADFDKLIEDGTINPELERDDVPKVTITTARKQASGAKVQKPISEQKEVQAICKALQRMKPEQRPYVWGTELPKYFGPELADCGTKP